MTIFDLFFLLAVLASAVTLAVALFLVLRGRWAKALRVLKTYAVCAAVYLLAGIAVSFFRPQRIMRPGDPWCFDDWCLTVESVSSTPGPTENSYQVVLRVFSRARAVSQRAKGAWVYLIDEHGHRYYPQPDPSAVPLDIMLQPGESITTSRRFRVQQHVRQLGLITGHGGAYCGAMAFLVMGDSGCLLGNPTLIRLQ